MSVDEINTFAGRSKAGINTLFLSLLIAGWARSVLPALHSGFYLSEFLMGPLFILTAIGFIPFLALFLIYSFGGLSLSVYKSLAYFMGGLEVAGGIYDFIERAPTGELPLLDAWSYLPFLQILCVIPIGLVLYSITKKKKNRRRRRMITPGSVITDRAA